MYKRKWHAPGSAPASLELPAECVGQPSRITLIEFDKEHFDERQVASIEDIFHCRDNGRVSWINIDGHNDTALLKKLGEHFGLHPLALEDVLHSGQRPKVEEYADHFFIVLQMTYSDGDDGIHLEQLSIFLKANVLITIQDEDSRDVFDPLRKRLRAGTGFARGRGHDYLAYALIDAVVDHFFPVLEKLGDTIEDLDEEMIERPRRELVLQLHKLKRSLLILRRSAWPQRDVLSLLNHDDSHLIQESTKPFLRDCYDHTVQIMDMTEGYRDLVTGLMDLYLSSVSQRTNEIMRVLTVISAVFIPLTFLVGLYGMNFENMPELHTRYGYFVLLGVMLTIALSMVAFFRHKKWL